MMNNRVISWALRYLVVLALAVGTGVQAQSVAQALQRRV
jgi:hypothetical protein